MLLHDNLTGDYHRLGQYSEKYKKVLYTPSSSFKALVAEDNAIISIDLRFIQLVRNKDIILAHDLYIYLVRRGYEKTTTSFVPWKTLHKDIFQNLEALSPSRFKRRFIRALNFILTCHPHAAISIDERDRGIYIPPSSNLLRSYKMDTS